MKTKIIKNLNSGLVVVLLCVSAGLGTVALFVQWENGEFDKTKLAGKIGESILGGGRGDVGATAVSDEMSGEPNINLAEGEGGVEMKIQEQPQAVNEIDAKFSFATIGDTKSYKDKMGFNIGFVDVLKKSKAYGADFALFSGDILSASGKDDNENKERIKQIKNTIEEHYNNYYIAFGENDVGCGDACASFWLETFFDIKTKSNEKKWLYHSFDYLNTHFVLLSPSYPEERSIDEKQLDWLENDLEKSTKPNKIVVQHVPPVSFFKDSAKDCHDMSCNKEVQTKLLGIFKENKVDLVISGSENAFDHKIVDDIDFVLSGQVGNKTRHKNVIKDDIYTLIDVDGENIELDALNTKGEIIRTISIKKQK
ncbi:MAG: metallophosphoesterase [Patescibacteria group bacterium]|nr:metallophosphoesterase [Patescibacteria group bacterium]